MKNNIKKTAVAENGMNSAEPVDMLLYWIGLDQGDKVSRYCILNEFSKVQITTDPCFKLDIPDVPDLRRPCRR